MLQRVAKNVDGIRRREGRRAEMRRRGAWSKTSEIEGVPWRCVHVDGRHRYPCKRMAGVNAERSNE